MKVIFDEIYNFRSQIQNRIALGFISHGGGGKATQSLENLISWSKLDLFHPVFSFRNSIIPPQLDEEITKICQNFYKAL